MNTAYSMRRWTWFAGAALFALGAVLTIRTFSVYRDAALRFARKKETLKVLQAELADLVVYRESRKMFDTLESKRPLPLAGILDKSGLASRVGDIREMKAKAVGGWVHLQSELVLNDVKVSEVADFIMEAGAMMPPWRVKRMIFRSSARENGVVQAILTMESLENQGP